MTEQTVLIEQAIYTSICNSRLDGYQLAAASAGVSRADAKELTRWGPAHDSLWNPSMRAMSFNFHWLESGTFCISRSAASGVEYSGRGGSRIYTHYLLATPASLKRFANHPLRLLEAAVALGHATVMSPIPKRLDPIHLMGRDRLVDENRLAELVGCCGTRPLAFLLDAVLTSQAVGFHSRQEAGSLLSGLFDLLPVPARIGVSFSTGLRYSPRRPFRLLALPDDDQERRRVVRQGELVLADLDELDAENYAPRSAWTRLVLETLEEGRFSALRRLVETADSNQLDGRQENAAKAGA